MSDLPPENLDRTNPKFWSRGPFKIGKKLVKTFSSSGVHRCDPPGPNKTQHVRLITIGGSHYSEKARWALDILNDDPLSPVYFTEDAHPPLFQSISTLEASNGKASMAPMVVFTENGEEKIIYDSKEIVMRFCPFLYPIDHKEEIVRLEEYFGSHVGATIRCYAYYYLLRPEYFTSVANLVSSQSSSIEKFLMLKLLGKGIAGGMLKTMGVTSESAEKSLQAARQAFSEVSERLRLKNGKKKEFMMDSEDEKVGFTAADLAFCACATPIIHPPEISVFMPYGEVLDMPAEIISLRDELRSTLAGKHVLEIYKKYRKTVVPKIAKKSSFQWKEILSVSKL
jgi:glutathione S-transferase